MSDYQKRSNLQCHLPKSISFRTGARRIARGGSVRLLATLSLILSGALRDLPAAEALPTDGAQPGTIHPVGSDEIPAIQKGSSAP